jgi:RNA polymerase sigma factor (sigma-70 family)
VNEKSDVQLLRDYAERRDETAFREIVTRHTDFVYSAALRQVGSAAIASDLAQSVFLDLAHKAAVLTRGRSGSLPESLAGWLHRATRYAALNHLRDTHRRAAIERQAMEQLLIHSEPSTDWEQIRPALDEALDSLGDEDREALLLRYFKNQDFRTVGLALGVSDDAAQKRVSRAVDRLRELFAKRGVTVGASGLVVVISANAVQAAPVGLAVTISTAAAALSGTAIHTATTIGTTKTVTMIIPLIQKAVITAAITSVIGVGIYETRRAASYQAQAQTLQQQQDSLSGDIQQLSQERDEAANKLAAASQWGDQLRLDMAEVSRLRGEVTRLQTASQELARLRTAASKKQPPKSAGGNLIPGATGTPFTFAYADAAPASGGIPPKPDYLVPVSNALMEKTNRLRQLFEQMPEKKIPESKYIDDQRWLGIAKEFNFDTEADIHDAMISLRNGARQTFGLQISAALRKFIVANNGDLPASLSQLKGYMSPPPDESLLARYKLVHSGKFVGVPRGEWGRMAIETGPPVDGDDSMSVQVGLFGVGLVPRK